MKNLLVCLFLLVTFLFGCSKSNLLSTTETQKDSCTVVSQDLDIASVELDTIQGKQIQIINLADGKQLIFGEEFMGISDLDLRINYMTYRQLSEYQNVKDTLVKQYPAVKSSLLDLLAFNQFLNDQGLKLITFEEYEKNIAIKDANQYKSGATVILGLAIAAFVICIVLIVILLERLKNKFNAFIDDEHNYIYMGRKNTS